MFAPKQLFPSIILCRSNKTRLTAMEMWEWHHGYLVHVLISVGTYDYDNSFVFSVLTTYPGQNDMHYYPVWQFDIIATDYFW